MQGRRLQRNGIVRARLGFVRTEISNFEYNVAQCYGDICDEIEFVFDFATDFLGSRCKWHCNMLSLFGPKFTTLHTPL